MNNELLQIFEQEPRYKEAFDDFLKTHYENHGKNATPEERKVFDEHYAERFLSGIKNPPKGREVLISGERLTIRKATLEDVDFMRSVELHPDNSEWVAHWPLGWRIAKFGDPDFLQTIVEREDGTPIGIIIFCDMRFIEERVQLKRIAILDKGKGYGKEALYLVQKLAFEVFGTKYLYLSTREQNLRAQSIYKKTGFVPETPDPCVRFHIALEDYQKQQ